MPDRCQRDAVVPICGSICNQSQVMNLAGKGILSMSDVRSIYTLEPACMLSESHTLMLPKEKRRTQGHQVNCCSFQEIHKVFSVLGRQSQTGCSLTLQAEDIQHSIKRYVDLLHCLIYWFLHTIPEYDCFSSAKDSFHDLSCGPFQTGSSFMLQAQDVQHSINCCAGLLYYNSVLLHNSQDARCHPPQEICGKVRHHLLHQGLKSYHKQPLLWTSYLHAAEKKD